MSEENPGDLTAVLVVDDNDTDAQFMKTVIEEAGYQVTTAAADDDGEALIVGQEWAIAFVDLMLPGDKDGVEVIQSGRKQHPHLPIIIVTGSSNAAFIDAAFRAGADVRLSKPIETEEILKQLRDLSPKKGAPVGTGPTPTETPEPTLRSLSPPRRSSPLWWRWAQFQGTWRWAVGASCQNIDMRVTGSLSSTLLAEEIRTHPCIEPLSQRPRCSRRRWRTWVTRPARWQIRKR